MSWLGALGAAALGVVSGVATLAVHDRSWAWWLLAVAAPAAVTLALAPGARRTAFVAGWFVVLFVAMLGRPEGDVVVGATPRGYALLGAALLTVCVAVVTIPRPRRGAS